MTITLMRPGQTIATIRHDAERARTDREIALAVFQTVSRKAGLPMEQILSETAEDTGVSVEWLKSRRRLKRVAAARHVAMWRMHREGHTAREIGEFLSRDHTTVEFGIRRVNVKMGDA